MTADVKRQRVVTHHDDDEEDDELLALLQASQLEARAPADVLQDDLGALCSKSAAAAARDPASSDRQQGAVLQEQHSIPAADTGTASTSDEPAGKPWLNDYTSPKLQPLIAESWDSSDFLLHFSRSRAHTHPQLLSLARDRCRAILDVSADGSLVLCPIQL